MYSAPFGRSSTIVSLAARAADSYNTSKFAKAQNTAKNPATVAHDRSPTRALSRRLSSGQMPGNASRFPTVGHPRRRKTASTTPAGCRHRSPAALGFSCKSHPLACRYFFQRFSRDLSSTSGAMPKRASARMVARTETLGEPCARRVHRGHPHLPMPLVATDTASPVARPGRQRLRACRWQ
jgi:hypothetical protein